MGARNTSVKLFIIVWRLAEHKRPPGPDDHQTISINYRARDDR